MYFEQSFQQIVDEEAENTGAAYLPEDAYELGMVYRDFVQEIVDETLPDDGFGSSLFILDLVNQAIRDVDFTEIARHYID